jgi:hypothetical protein
MSRAKLGPAPNHKARSSATPYALYDGLIYAPRGAGAASAAGSSPPARGRASSSFIGRAVAGRARGFDGPPGMWARLGVRRRISVHGQIIDCRGVLTFVPDEPATFWLMYDVCAALAVMAGALLGLAT